MNCNVVKTIIHEPTLSCGTLPLRFSELCLTPGFNPIIKFAFWILKKFGSSFWDETVTYKQVVYKEGDLFLKLIREKQDIDRIWRGEIKRILVGYKQFNEIANCEIRGNGPWTFRDYAKLGNGRAIEIFGIPVTVIPWMDGILLLPDLEKL